MLWFQYWYQQKIWDSNPEYTKHWLVSLWGEPHVEFLSNLWKIYIYIYISLFAHEWGMGLLKIHMQIKENISQIFIKNEQ